MKTKNSQPTHTTPKTNALVNEKKQAPATGQPAQKEDGNAKDKKGKKKHSSALAAAAVGRSATSQVKPEAYRDGNYMHTGTNLSYREEEEGE